MPDVKMLSGFSSDLLVRPGSRGLPGRPSLGLGPGVAWPKSRFVGVRAGRAAAQARMLDSGYENGENLVYIWLTR